MEESLNFLWGAGGGYRSPKKGFFAFPASPPSIPEIISSAIEAINRSNETEVQSWRDVRTNGSYIIDTICNAINEADFFCADMTGINPNVMFELGYAITTDKRVWLVRDDTYVDARKEFDQLRILTTIGFSPYQNSGQMIKAFFAERPDKTTDKTIWKDSIEPVLATQLMQPSLLYLKNQHETEASLKVTRALENAAVPLVINDPRETSIRPAYWYAQQLFDSPGLIVHFSSSDRDGFRLHNSRYALVAGMAYGFGRRILMLSEQGDLLAPIDYRDAMKAYTTPREAGEIVSEWISPISQEVTAVKSIQANRAKALRLATELKDFHLQLGDFVAEGESNRLNEYFVETTVSADIINGTQNVFVGRKGTGKSANLIHAESVIGADVNNLVCLIRPVGYELEGLVRLFNRYKLQDYKGYVIESLWKFMIYTELARSAVQQIKQAELWRMTEPDAHNLVNLLEDDRQAFGGDFGVRLERVVNSLETVANDESGDVFRKGISEAIHSGALSKLRAVLVKALSRKHQVILLVDNLDKTWTRDADLQQLAQFLLGLLTATNRVGAELSRAERDREAANFSSAIFLRSDIFESVLAAAREPDKLSFTRIKWDDDELLLRVIEERYIASHGQSSDPADMWRKYFVSQVKGTPTRHYITTRILKRPRDIVFLVKAAVSFAVNRKHDRVEEKDILDAEREYGQYALDSILVESGATFPLLEDVVFQFSGGKSTNSEQYVCRMLSAVGVSDDDIDGVIERLLSLSFLGLEVSDGDFAFSEEARELKLNKALAARFNAGHPGERRFQVNTAFRAYLKIDD